MSTAAPSRPSLTAEPRAITGKKVAAIRREGRLPAVVYGHGIDSANVSLVDFDAVIKVSDLTIPGDVTLLTDPDEIIAKVQAPRIEVEPEPVVAEGEEEAEEGAEEGAAEGATPSEGGPTEREETAES